MKKLLIFVLSITTFTGKLQAEPYLGFRSAYFTFTDSNLRDVYDRGGIDFQICMAYPLWNWLQIYSSIEYSHKSGKSLNFDQSTRIKEFPASIGLQGYFDLYSCVKYYVTIGPKYFWINVHNESDYVPKKLSANKCGGFIGTGFHLYLQDQIFLDPFIEYSYVKIQLGNQKNNVVSNDVQAGGLVIGCGLGFKY